MRGDARSSRTIPRYRTVEAYGRGTHGGKEEATLNDRRRELTRQLVVRVDDQLYETLERDAEVNGRTIAQSVRFKLRELASAE